MVQTLLWRCVVVSLGLVVVNVAPQTARASLLLGAPGDIGTAKIFNGESGFTAGFSFTVGPTALRVTRLGILDVQFDTNGAGLFEAHQIGLWTGAGVLLGSTTVPAGAIAPLVNGFRFADLSSAVLLSPGQTYVLGAQYPTDLLSDPNPDVPLVETPAQMAALITGATFVQGLFTGQGVNSFSFPTVADTNGFVGPNLDFIASTTPSRTRSCWG